MVLVIALGNRDTMEFVLTKCNSLQDRRAIDKEVVYHVLFNSKFAFDILI